MKRGFFRLWIVISTIWVIGWYTYVWETRLHAVEDKTGRSFVAFHTDFGNGWRELKDFGLADYLALIERGLALPAGLLIVGATIGWIGSGFRPRSN